jgi:predicted DNA-binding transcriptional regulator AlpA
MTARYLTSDEAAEYLGVSRKLLELRRTTGGGPRFIKLSPTPNGAVRYDREDLDAWMASRRVESTSEVRP